MAEKQASGKPFTFHSSSRGQLLLDLDAALLAQDENITAREGYSEQESRFLKYLASKGHIGGTA